MHQESDNYGHDDGQAGVLQRIKQWVGSREIAVILALGIFCGSLWAFVELADETLEGETENFDRVVLMSMRTADKHDPIGPGWFEEMGRDVTALGGTTIVGLTTLAVIGFLILDNRKRLAIVVLLATAGSMGANTILKESFDRSRPDVVSHGTETYTSSFPSGHSMLAASTYLTLGALLARTQRRRRVKLFIVGMGVALTVLVGVSRVYMGVHWPTDVLAGWTAGAAWAVMCWAIAVWLQRHGEVEPETG